MIGVAAGGVTSVVTGDSRRFDHLPLFRSWIFRLPLRVALLVAADDWRSRDDELVQVVETQRSHLGGLDDH